MVVLTKKSISATITGNPIVSTTAEGCFIVHVGSTGNAIIEGVTPAQTEVGGSRRNGASFNLPGSAESTPFDGRYNYNSAHTLTYPKVCYAGDVVIFSKSHAEWNGEGLYSRVNYWPTGDGARSYVDEMLIIIFVAYPKSDSSEHLRGFGLGNSPAGRWLRANIPITWSMLNVASLPSVINLSIVTNPVETSYFANYLSGIFGDFCGDVLSSWGGDAIAPSEQHPGYARNLMSLVSQAMCVLCSNRTELEKWPLAISMTQWGLDLAGAWLDGRFTSAQNGHGQGRKALIILAGYLLGVDQLKNPDTTFLKCVNKFQETHSFSSFDVPGTKWFMNSPTWTYKWCAKEDVPTYGEFWQYHPSAWSNNDVTWAAGYFEHTTGSQVGTVLAMQLMGLRASYGEAPMSFIEYWMDGPGAGALATIATYQPALANVPWGNDYSIGGGTNMCEEAWANHWPL